MSTAYKTNSVRQGLSFLGKSLLLLSVLGAVKVNAQTLPTAKPSEPAYNDASIETLPLLRTRLTPVESIAPVRGEVMITLRNISTSEITYEAIASTDPRTLASGEEVVLSGLNAPTTVVFYQKDGGLTQAAVSDVSNRDDAFKVEFTQAPTLSEDDNSIVLLTSGNIFLM